jgi:putative oxidoreductase
VSRARVLALVVLVVRVAIGAVFLVAGAAKVGHAAEFAVEIAGFRLLPQAVIAPMALGLPLLEILLGACLVLGVFTRTVAWIAVAVFALFDLAIASAVVRGMAISCGCFGPGDASVTTWGEVARDAIFIVLALAVALRPPGALALDSRINALPAEREQPS